jgi:hypothetical protein
VVSCLDFRLLINQWILLGLPSEFFYLHSFVSRAESTSATNESVLKVALDHGKASLLVCP